MCSPEAEAIWGIVGGIFGSLEIKRYPHLHSCGGKRIFSQVQRLVEAISNADQSKDPKITVAFESLRGILTQATAWG